MYEHIILEKEQIDLLSSFIDIIKDVPREKRIKFIATQMSNGTTQLCIHMLTVNTYLPYLEIFNFWPVKDSQPHLQQ